MELVGEEKKIRALFSELKLADEHAAPAFAAVLSRARTRDVRPARAFNFAFVAATALLVCAVVSLAWWSRHWQSAPRLNLSAASPSVLAPARMNESEPEPERTAIASSTPTHSSVKTRSVKLVTRRQSELLAANRSATREAQAISNWKSPTSVLLDSPSDEILTTLPQFKQTVEDLKSFLPNR